MALQVVGEGKAGVQSGLLDQVRKGGIEMAVMTNGFLAPRVQGCAIPSIGFLFADYRALWPAMDGALGAIVRKQASTQLEIEILDKVWDFGFRDITTSTRPIRTAGDIGGLKIRTQIDSDEMDLFRSLNAVPVVITLPFLRMALDHRQIDGQEGLLQIVEYARLNEVQHFCAMTRHVWDGLWICANPAAWKSIPERYRNIIANTVNAAALRQRETAAAEDETRRASLEKAGLAFNDIDIETFRDTLRRQGYYARLKARYDAQTWTAIEAVSGRLG